MREQLEFLEHPPEPAWEAMREWLRHHGIDPNRVPVRLWLDRCEETRRIRYPEILLGVDPARTGGDAAIVVGIVPRTLQLEAAPAPFPRLAGRFNYTCVSNPALAEVLTVPPTWPATPRLLGSLCGPG